MSNDTRATSSMAGVVGIGSVVVALFSIDWTQLFIDLFWSLIGFVLSSGERFVDAVVSVVQFIFS